MDITTSRAAHPEAHSPHNSTGVSGAIFTCHDCFHIGPSAPELVDGFEIVDGKSEDRVFEVCERCQSAEIYPVGEPA